MPKLPVRGAQPEELRDDGSDPLDPTGFVEISATTAPPARRDSPDPDGDPRWASGPEPQDLAKLAEAQSALDELDVEARPARRPAAPRPPAVKIAVVLVLAAALAITALAYRSHHRKQVLAQGRARALELLRADTRGGYLEAARLLEPLMQLDRVDAASMRAFALAMLAADYRDDGAGRAAEALLVEPERAPQVPRFAILARAARALSRREAGTATTFASRAEGDPIAAAILARVAVLAGNLPGAAEALDAAGREPQFAATLAVRGDVLRRRKEPEAARGAYAAALEIAPAHPRSAYGMAKLALAGSAPAGAAMPALQRVLQDSAAAVNERARAALHLAALRARLGDRAGAAAAIASVGLEPGARAWLERAAGQEELDRTGYHVVDGAPDVLQSASDDDPYEPPPPAPPKVEPAAKAVPAAHAIKAAPSRAAKTKTSHKAVAKALKPSKRSKSAKPTKSAKSKSAKKNKKKTANR